MPLIGGRQVHSPHMLPGRQGKQLAPGWGTLGGSGSQLRSLPTRWGQLLEIYWALPYGLAYVLFFLTQDLVMYLSIKPAVNYSIQFFYSLTLFPHVWLSERCVFFNSHIIMVNWEFYLVVHWFFFRFFRVRSMSLGIYKPRILNPLLVSFLILFTAVYLVAKIVVSV